MDILYAIQILETVQPTKWPDIDQITQIVAHVQGEMLVCSFIRSFLCHWNKLDFATREDCKKTGHEMIVLLHVINVTLSITDHNTFYMCIFIRCFYSKQHTNDNF